jgi:hypothetical protein
MNEQMNPLMPQNTEGGNEEQLVWEGSPKWQADFGYLFLSVLTMIAGFALMGLFLSKWGFSLFSFLPPLLISFTGFIMFTYLRLKRRNEHYKMTNLNLEYESGVLSKTIQNTELWRIKDIVFKQSLGERILGICKIELVTTDASSPLIILEGLPPGRRIYDDLKKAFVLARQRKNVIGMVE